MFHSHLIYSSQIWGQNNTILRKLEPLQNKALRIINFKNNEYNVNELYKTNKILKIADYIKLLNCLFVRDVIAQSTIPPFQEFFIQMRDTHQHNTRHATQNTVTLNQYKNDFYGTHFNKAPIGYNTMKRGEIVWIILLEVLYIESHQLHQYLCLYF